ncbi:competence protein ComK [Sutcliffiella halmapala]
MVLIVEDYEVSETTMALMVYAHPQHQTKILDLEGDFITSESSKDLLNHACLNEGCTAEGRRTATIMATNYIQKTPLLVNQVEGIIAIPTHSPDQHTCCWIFLHHVLQVTPITPAKCKITFQNYTEIELDVSAATIREQMKKASIVQTRFCSNQRYAFWLNPKPRRKMTKRRLEE